MAEKRPRCTNFLLRSGAARAVALLLAAVLATGGCALPRVQGRHLYEIPEQLDDGWDVSSLATEGMDVATIGQVVERIESGRYGRVHSLLIVKNDALVYEGHFGGFRRDTLHRLYSVTKSVTSALVGIAIDKGYINGVDEPAISFFPEYVDEAWDHRKDAITLQHLLTMSAGLQYDEQSYPYRDSRNSHTQMTAAYDWMKWTLKEPLVAEPGTRFAYSTGNTHLFSGILQKTTGMYASQFAEEHLFGPLGISDYYWYIGDGFPAAGGSFGGLKLRPRDMAKFGYVYLTGGRWKGVQVVPAEWVRESFVPRITAWWDSQYGYYWWIHSDQVSGREINWFAARGYGDQFICLFPSLDMVVVITCGNEAVASRVEEAIMTIVEAALKSEPASGNQTAPVHDAGTGWILLVPMRREELGFSGVMPQGWIETAPGEFVRGSSPTDQTQLIQQAFPGMTMDEVIQLGSSQLGIDALPEYTSKHRGAALTWDLYSAYPQIPDAGHIVLRAALASTRAQGVEEQAGATYAIVLLASAEDYEAEGPLLETLFLHTAYALTPLE